MEIRNIRKMMKDNDENGRRKDLDTREKGKREQRRQKMEKN